MSKPDNLYPLFDRLRRSTPIKSNPKLVELLYKIEKSSTDNQTLAYLLGLFFQNKIDSDNLIKEDKEYLLAVLKHNGLLDYYYLKNIPSNFTLYLEYVLLVCGLMAIIAGIVQLDTGGYWVGYNLRYLQRVVDDGRWKLLLGIFFIIIASILFYQHKGFRSVKRELLVKENLRLGTPGHKGSL